MSRKQTTPPLIILLSTLFAAAFIFMVFVGAFHIYHQSQIRNVIHQYKQHIQAISLFQDIYHSLPGDHKHAKQIWPFQKTMNGNGNGAVEHHPNREDLIAWQHLILAGFYTEPLELTDRNPKLFINIPGSRIANAGFEITYTGTARKPEPVHGYIGNSINFASLWNDRMQGASLKASDAKEIDQKMDDGNPTTGKLLAHNGADSTFACLTKERTYHVHQDYAACRLFYPLHLTYDKDGRLK